MRLTSWTGYAAIPRRSRYASGLTTSRETLIRLVLYQRIVWGRPVIFMPRSSALLAHRCRGVQRARRAVARD